ncbi:hypothetical protein ACFO5K_24085 [Nocardia halotolerans]|uniref:Uncharacterized protein n=1 Tax=Nocardia halotolerans TaxID=1755878 RepID=A0ABV8VM71_9NOCA
MADLLPAATDLAHNLKTDELGATTATLSITCVCEHLPGRTALHDSNFQQHPWDGTPTPDAEYLIWETEGP